MREVEAIVRFKIGTGEELGYGGFKQPWIAAKKGDRKLELLCGAGVGSPLIEVMVTEGKEARYAHGDIRDLAAFIFRELELELDGEMDDEDGPAEDAETAQA